MAKRQSLRSVKTRRTVKAPVNRRPAESVVKPSRSENEAPTHPLLALQRQLGNTAVARLIAQRSDHEEDAVQRSVLPRSAAGSTTATIQLKKTSDELTDMAEAGGSQEMDDQQQNVNQPPALRVSNVRDIYAAKTLVSQLENWRGPMQAGAGKGGAFVVSPHRVTPEKMEANETAISALDDYLVTAGEQSRTTSSFQDALRKTRTNYARLKGQITHLEVKQNIAGGATAGEIGQQIVHSAGLGDSNAAQQRMKRMEQDPHSSLGSAHIEVQKAHDELVTLGQQAGQKQSTVSQSAYHYYGALNAFKSGVPTVNDNPDQKKELDDLKAKIESVKKWVGKGLEYAGKGLEKVGVKGAETVGEHAGGAVDWLTDQFYDAQLNDIQTKVNQYNQAHTEHKVTSMLDDVRAASTKFISAITDFNDAVEKFSWAQTNSRDRVRMLGGMADAASGHGDHFAQVASVLAEVDTFELQLDQTLRLAYQEQTAAGEAASSRQTLEHGGPAESGGGKTGLPYYSPYAWFHPNGGWGVECQVNELRLRSGDSRGSALGDADVGVNETVDQAVKDLQDLRRQADSMRASLAKAMDLNMNEGMPTTAGGPAPTARSANTGL